MSQNDATRTVTISYDLSAPAVVTFDIQTNDVETGTWASIGQKYLTQASGDVAKKVDKSSGIIHWQPNHAWPSDTSRPEGVRALVKAWALNGLPDYMVIDLVLPGDVRFYVSEDALPGGIGSDLYRTDKIVMRKIPAAMVRWRMGSPADEHGVKVWNGSQNVSSAATEPIHYVTLSKDYYMGVFEVTQAQYGRMLNGSNPSTYKNLADSPLHPVETLTWNACRGNAWPTYASPSANSFFGKLSAHAGIVDTFDLPTEAQWEFACRAGTDTGLNNGTDLISEGGWYKQDDALLPVGWSNGNMLSSNPDFHTWKVGLKKANAWGLYDMHGNVGEFCLDTYVSGQDISQYPAVDPVEPVGLDATYCVYRGGGFDSRACYSRSGSRQNTKRGWNFNNLGFRVCCGAEVK